MKENNVETGRSMLETLAVLAIIMVITIASIAGFDYLVQYRNRMETVKTVNLLISSIKSGNLGRHRAQSDPNSIWDAGEIVKGPKIEESALVLPDSDYSYAVVRTLNNGGWVMAMQINPKTCDEMFKSLTAQGAIVYRMFNKSGELSASQSALRLGSNKDNGDNDTFIGVASGSVARLAGTGESDRGCATVSGEDDCRLGVNLKYVLTLWKVSAVMPKNG